MKKNRQRQDKNKKLCVISHKYVGNKEVVLLEYAIDYVKQLGYIVEKPERRQLFRSMMTFIISSFILIIMGVCLGLL